ncbi:hypothetical protein QVD17_31221 [Tagetes erecta]|uniref:Wound-induced protein 1 n=1 Tax=Tagetes erecta TaxID=13708 RepID=A0AAD8NGT3_TARER|nr:hypothetical protein QVD17_31221 [Tagetes erecta]
MNLTHHVTVPSLKYPNYPSSSSYKTPSPPKPFHQSIIPISDQLPTTLTELANLQAQPLTTSGNGNTVLTLYHALTSRDVQLVNKLLSPDLEWWFHGPRSHQFMMQLLTGTDNTSDTFQFVPHSIDAFGSTVIVEGCDQGRDISWIHVWSVDSNGVITQVREYFNTSLTVTRFVVNNTSKPVVSVRVLHCPSVWESSLSNRVGKSVPGLVLAI